VAEPARIGGATRVAAVLGWPVGHSLSPAIHNAAFHATDLDAVYVALPVRPGDVPSAVEGLAASGFLGANVTMPHKDAAAEAVGGLTDDAARLRAVNTIEIVGDATVGHNTDAPGFSRFLERDVGFDARDATVLLFGAGGAARACALAVARAGAAEIVVALREPARVAALSSALADEPTVVRVVPFDEAAAERANLIVNATPLGAHGESLPLPVVDTGTLAVDLLYLPIITPLQRAVRQAGGVAFGGLGLLVQQAALAFEVWTGRPAPIEAMSAAAIAAIGARP